MSTVQHLMRQIELKIRMDAAFEKAESKGHKMGEFKRSRYDLGNVEAFCEHCNCSIDYYSSSGVILGMALEGTCRGPR